MCIGLPLTRGAFDRAAKRATGFVRGILDDNAHLPSSAVWTDYRVQVSGAVMSACHTFRSRGARVIAACDAGRFAASLDEFAAVVLISHFAEPRIRPLEIRDPTSVLEAIASGRDWALALVRSRFDEYANRPEMFGDPSDPRDALAKILDEFLLDALRARAGATDRLDPLVNLTRDTLFRSLRGALRESRPLELRDQMHALSAVLHAVPRNKHVTLDLTACHSVDIAERLRTARPRCRVVGRDRPEDLPTGLLRICTTLDVLAERPRPYIEASTEASLRLAEELSR